MATYGHQAREDTMGELIVTEFVTLDGVAQAPGAPDEDRDGGFAHGGWQAPLLDQEVDRAGRTRDKRNGGRLVSLAEDLKGAVAPFEPQVFDVRGAGLTHAQTIEAEQHCECGVIAVVALRGE
jgi:hypothetical protein